MIDINIDELYVSTSGNATNLNQILSSQQNTWQEYIQVSVDGLKDLCSQSVLNVKAICMLAWDIVDMSKTTPSWCSAKETVDLSNNVNPVIAELASYVDQFDHGKTPEIQKQAKILSVYLNN